MALQPLSEAGADYSPSALLGDGASRPISIAADHEVTGLVAEHPSRAISVIGLGREAGSLVRGSADRAMAVALGEYASGGILSLLNLRFLSVPLAAYAPGSVQRSSPSRPLSLGYLAFLQPPPAPPVDESQPVVGSFNPAPGTPIARTAPISFEVTDDSSEFRRIFVIAFFPATGATEVVHDGDAFRGHYAAGSARTMIGGGFRYSVVRTGGWPGAPTIQTFAIDRAGNEAS